MTVSGSGAGPSHQDFTGVIKAGTSNFCLDNNGAGQYTTTCILLTSFLKPFFLTKRPFFLLLIVNKENKLQVWTCNGLPWQEWIFHSFDRTIQLSSQGDLTYRSFLSFFYSNLIHFTYMPIASSSMRRLNRFVDGRWHPSANR